MADVTKDTNRPVKAVQIAIGTGSNTLSVKTETPPAPEQQKENCEIPANFVAPPKSKGEKIYEWAVYRGMNYWFNLFSSVAFTDWFEHGWKNVMNGRKGLNILKIDKAIDGIAKFLSSKTSLSPQKAHSYTENSFIYFALTMGGTALVIPLKLLEDRKRPIVHWLNKKFGVDQTAQDGHELTPDEIYIEKEQPRQSWARAFGRRLIGMGAVLASGNLIDYTLGKNNVTNFVMDGKEGLHGVQGKGGVNKLLNAIPGGKKLVTTRWTQSWMRYIVLDSLFTEITASVMWMTNGAKKEKKPQEIGVVAVKEGEAGDTGQTAPALKSINPENFRKVKDGREALAESAHLSHAEKIAAESNPSLQPSL